MSVPLRVLITTDSFPPNCGGSGWSTWELVRGLNARGHHVDVVRIDANAPQEGVVETSYQDWPVTIFNNPSTSKPLVRNIAKNELLWSSFEHFLTRRLETRPADIIHAQHVMTTVPSIRAGAAGGVPVVATVRDYWPVCYWSTLIYNPAAPDLCPSCTIAHMARCVAPRVGGLAIAGWPVIPYMRANLKRKRETLARASAIIAVSSVIADDLKARAPELAATELFTIPNPIDLSALEAHDRVVPLLAGPYVIYAGKLEPNKGVQFLVDAYARSGLTWPLVIAGDGSLRADIERDARARGIDLRVLGWLDRHDVWTWMRHAAILAFPSYGPESLSRVLIEGAALGLSIAAMDTGGTRDIVQHEATGLLSTDAEGLGRDLARLAHDDRLRAALGSAARAHARARFAAESVVARIEQVYRGLIPPRAA